MRVHCRILAHRRSDVLQLGFLRVARERNPTALIGRRTLFQGRVIEPATCPHDTVQRPLLLRGGSELVLVGFAQALTLGHDYGSSLCLCRVAYSRNAQITSPLKERSCCLASARIAANRSNGKRIEMRRSPLGVFSM